jgi:hypothetical protein
MGKADAHVQDLSLDELARRVKQGTEDIDKIEGLFPGLATLPEDERRTSKGRFRHGEPQMLMKVLDVADYAPPAFGVLADKDGGKDPKKFETDYLRDALQRASVLDELATDLEELARNVRDTQLELASKPKEVVLAKG